MRWLILPILVAFGLLFSLTSVAMAQQDDSADTSLTSTKPVNIFPWYNEGNPDFQRGALYAGLGLVGALATVFGIVGGAIPGSPGQARIDADQARLNTLYQRLEVMIDDSTMQAPMVSALESTVNNLRDDLRKERWRQFFFATLIYAVGGAFFASALSLNMLQALVVGAGWTGVLGTLGIRTDSLFRHVAKDASIDKLASKMGTLAKTQPTVVAEIGGSDRVEALLREASIARALTRHHT